MERNIVFYNYFNDFWCVLFNKYIFTFIESNTPNHVIVAFKTLNHSVYNINKDIILCVINKSHSHNQDIIKRLNEIGYVNPEDIPQKYIDFMNSNDWLLYL